MKRSFNKLKERKLVYRAQKGEPEAFGNLYDNHVTRIYRFIFLRIGHKEDAEDITQRVFLKAWKNIGSYEPRNEIPFSSWLYRIAKHTIIDHYRSHKDHVSIDILPEKVFGVDLQYEKKIDDNFEMEQVRSALLELTDDQQEIIVLKFIEELSNQEIADILDKTEGAVRVAQHRALKRLKKILQHE